MATLESINGADLVPDLVGSVSKGYQLGAGIRQNQKQVSDAEQMQVLRQKIMQGGPDAYDSWQKLGAIDPNAANDMTNMIQNRYLAADKQTQSMIEKHGQEAHLALLQAQNGSVNSAREYVQALAQHNQDMGLPSDQYQKILQMDDNDFLGSLKTHAAIFDAGIAAKKRNSDGGEAYGQLYTGTDPATGQAIQFQLTKAGVPVSLSGQSIDASKLSNVMPLTYDPGINQGRSFATTTGTKQAEASSALPGVISSATRKEALIDDLLKEDSGLDGVVGPKVGLLPDEAVAAISKKNAKAISRIKQLSSAAWLQGFESELKGNGAGTLTESEGDQLKAYAARLGRQQSPEDFRQALTEFKDLVRTTRENAMARAGQGAKSAQGRPAASAIQDSMRRTAYDASGNPVPMIMRGGKWVRESQP